MALEYKSDSFTAPASTVFGGEVWCPDNEIVTGGGVWSDSSTLTVNTSSPLDSEAGDPPVPDADTIPDNGWVGWVNNSGAETTFTVWAICTAVN